MPVSPSTDQRPLPPQQGDGEVINARRARQGFRDRPVLLVLIAAFLLTAIGFGIAFMTNNNQQSAAERGVAQTTDRAAVATFDTPEPAPKVVPPR